MDSSGNDYPSGLKPVNRPEYLKYLCILSFIGSGLAVVSNLFIFLSYDEIVYLTDEMKINFPEFEMMMSGGKRFFITGFVLYSISLLGVIRMWKLKKVGFHLYTIAQIFIIALPVVLIPAYPFSVLSILVTAAFILGYGVHLKIMN